MPQDMWALGLVDPRTFRPQDKWFYQDKCDLGQLDPNPKNPQDRWALVLLDPRTVYPQYQWTLVPMGHSTTGPQYNWVSPMLNFPLISYRTLLPPGLFHLNLKLSQILQRLFQLPLFFYRTMSPTALLTIERKKRHTYVTR